MAADASPQKTALHTGQAAAQKSPGQPSAPDVSLHHAQDQPAIAALSSSGVSASPTLPQQLVSGLAVLSSMSAADAHPPAANRLGLSAFGQASVTAAAPMLAPSQGQVILAAGLAEAVSCNAPVILHLPARHSKTMNVGCITSNTDCQLHVIRYRLAATCADRHSLSNLQAFFDLHEMSLD